MSDKKNSNVHVVSLSNYVSPVIKEDQSKDWVTYGKKNEYWQYLIDRSTGSTTNAACIQFMIKLIVGGGLTASDKARNPQAYAAMKGIFKDKDVRRISDDFKRLGHAIIQVRYKGKHKSIESGTHFPVEQIAPQKLQEGEDEIQGFYYPKNFDWSKVHSKGQLNFVPAFGTSKEGVEFLYIKTYSPGLFYYSVVDYSPALQWAETEEEVANYHINNIQNGFAPSMMVNFNNGVPSPQVQKDIVKKINQKYKGSSKTGEAFIAFNDSKENAGTIEAVQLSDASDQYQFVSDEAKQQILTGHRIPSPLLLGIPSGSGFSSTADELKTAFTLLEHQEAMYFREILINAFDQILAFNNISLDLEFESLNPFDNGEEQVLEQTKLSHGLEFDDKEMFEALDKFGEDEDLKNWELVDEREVDYDAEDALDQTLMLVNTGTARPNAKSEQDGEGASGEVYKVRYQYNPLRTSQNSRTFCKMMVNAAKIYRKEDIIQMGSKSVNPGWGAGGANTYSIWLYKGGGGCGHRWFRKTYKSRNGVVPDVNNPRAQTVSRSKQRQDDFRAEENESMVSRKPGSTNTGQFLDGREWTPKP